MIEAYVIEASASPLASADAVERAAAGDTSNLIRGGGSSNDVGEQLRAAGQSGLLRILASPRFLTRLGESVEGKSGVTFAVQVNARGTTTVQFKDAVLGFEVTPSLGPDGLIGLNIDVNKDSPRFDLATDERPGVIQTTAVRGLAIVKDGGTAVIVGPHEITNNEFEPGPQLLVLVTARFVQL